MYYAVKEGRVPGIYDTWAECERMTKGFPQAKFKKFKTIEEAQSFLSGEDIVSSLEKVESNPIVLPEVYAFVDGSFNPNTNTYGYGGFVFVNGVKHVLQGCGNDEEMAAMRNVSGEILGSMAAIQFAVDNNLPELTILYDYQGIESWAMGTWKTNKNGTKAYKEFFNQNSSKVNIIFKKVKGHSGVDGNEEADKLAKQAVGI